MRQFSTILKVILVNYIVMGCTNVSDFSTTGRACYRGKIVDDATVRLGFEAEVQLELSLDVDLLGQGGDTGLAMLAAKPRQAAVLTTSDGRFFRVPVQQMTPLAHDALSLLQFPGGRVRNYVAHALPNLETLATVVISLMENEAVEVRVLKPLVGTNPALFGVFRLKYQEDCSPI